MTEKTSGGTASVVEETAGGGERTEPICVDGPGPRSAESFGITCSGCGGSLRVHEGQRSIRCEYCGAALLVTSPRGVRSFIVKPKITPGAAKLAAIKHISSSTGGRVRARHASIVDLRLVNVPFWRMKGRMAGWLCGDRIERHGVEVPAGGPDGTATVTRTEERRKPFSKIIFKRVDWSTPACVLRHLGLQGISLKTRMLEWEIYDHSMRNDLYIALPMKTARQAMKDGYSYMTTLASPSGASIRSGRFDMYGRSLSLYYYPVYVLRYRHGRRIFTITVDAHSGGVIRGGVPESGRISRKSLFFVPAAAAFLAGTWFPLVVIAAAGIYIRDIFASGSVMPPHRWLVRRLESWFGGDLR